jgi:hypothetical protein
VPRKQSAKQTDRDDAEDLVSRARRGDKTALPALRKMLDTAPQVASTYGDLAANARRLFADMLAGQDLLLFESVMRHADALRDEMAGPNASPLERILAERIAVCWVHVQWADSIYVQTLKQGNASLALIEHLQKRQDRCHRRLLTGVQSLATVRKLMRPTVAQVNIAEKQVNIAAGAAGDDAATRESRDEALLCPADG